MKLRYIAAMMTLTFAMVFSLAPIVQAETGPESDLKIYFYADDSQLWGGLVAGEIDMEYWEATPAQYQAAINMEDIQLAAVPRLDFRGYSLNNNETIAFYPGVKSVMTDANFRKALHRLTNKQYYVSTILSGFGEALPVVIAAPSSGWMNMSVVDYVLGRATTRYPYPFESLTFDRQAAKDILTYAGFVDIDGDGWRNYPAGWPGRPGRPNLDPIKFFIRSDDILRKTAGLDQAAEMEGAGIPVDRRVEAFATCYTYVMSNRNFHMYTAGWSVGRFPTYQFGWFHSSRWFPGGSNYHCAPYGLGGLPEQLTIDALVEKVWLPPTYEAAMVACKDSQYLVTEKLCLFIPMWSSKAFYPYRSDLLAVTNEQSVGPENDYTYLKAHRADGSPTVRAGTKSPPLEVNPIYSRWVWDVSVLGPYMGGFINLAPYNIMRDQPWLCQDWTSPPDSWYDAGVEKSKMTYWFRDDPVDGLGDKDAEWIEPVTGTVLEDFEPQWVEGYLGTDGQPRSGYEFNCWYYRSEPAGWIYTGYADIHHIRVYPDEKKAEVYMNVKSYWSMYWPYGREIYAQAWKLDPLCVGGTVQTATFAGPIAAGTNLPLPYQTKGAPVEIAQIKLLPDNTLLTKASGANNNDYEMVLGKIKMYTAIPTGKSIEVKYWARGDPAGYVPGSLYGPNGVGKAHVGAGSFYMTELVPGAGGWATYKKNPHCWIETPPEGEIDFWWNWPEESPITRPRKGYYTVDIYDVVKGTWALDSQGYKVPDPHWVPGVDLRTEVHTCFITVHDIAVISGDVGYVCGATP